ncbi:kinase-like domain-containing protein [Hyaloraphidium curvatum]|nr:kinase-like domain-containing protein [Hyaloraphidium curvatum]
MCLREGNRGPADMHGASEGSCCCGDCGACRSLVVAEGRARRKEFTLVRALGAGASGTVHAAVCRRTGAAVAVKSCRKAAPGVSAAGCDRAALRRRLAAVAALRHPNLLRVYDFFETSGTCYAVMELAEGGDLDAYLSSVGRLPERDIRSVLHGPDVKPANVLLRRKDDPSSVVLADFDGCFVSNPGEDAPGMKTLVGTPYFLAPELVSGKGYGPEVDVYAAGCIAFLLACGRTPFGDSSSFGELYSRISSGGWLFPSSARISRSLEDLICSMLRTDPAGRPSASAALAHPFVAPCARRRSASGVRVRFDEMTGELVPEEGGRRGTGWGESGAEAVELALGARAAMLRAGRGIHVGEASSV